MQNTIQFEVIYGPQTKDSSNLLVVFGLVSMELGSHLFPFRTQQLSQASVTILWRQSHGKIARRQVLEEVGLKPTSFLFLIDHYD